MRLPHRTPSPLDLYLSQIQAWLDRGYGPQKIADLIEQKYGFETSERSVRRAIERHGLSRPERYNSENGEQNPGVEYDGDSATVTSDTLEDLGDAEHIIRSRGLNPDDWVVERIKVNEWDTNIGEGETKTLRQLTIHLKRRIAMTLVTPAVHVPHLSSIQKIKIDRNSSFLAVIVGDEQEPYADPILKELFLAWLSHNKPAIGVHLGDLMDFPTISRHKDNPEWGASAQECINAGYRTLRSYVESSRGTDWQMLVGNHDERLRNELLLRAERMYGIKPADTGEEDQDDALSIKRLLHLDALGIEFIAPRGGYAHASIKLSPLLGVRHGWLTGANAASSTLDRLGHSIIVGHTHRQRIHYKTVYSIDDNPLTLQAVEAGTMGKVKDGLGYTVNPDWQNGFATATIYPDGSFHVELATYSNGVLKWRNQRYEA